MLKSKITAVTCPNCGKNGEFNQYNVINITENPSARDRIMSREIFSYTCPFCGEKILVSYDCIYLDTENKYCTALIENEIPSVVKNISTRDFTVRIVHSINEFIEKIALLEDGIDDRVCELCKLFLEESYEEQNNAELLAAYFIGKDIENETLHFYLIGDDAGNCETTLSLQSYRNILEYFSNSEFDKKEETEINSEWALLALKNGIFDRAEQEEMQK